MKTSPGCPYTGPTAFTPAFDMARTPAATPLQPPSLEQSVGAAIRDLRQSALMKDRNGATSLAEINRVTKD